MRTGTRNLKRDSQKNRPEGERRETATCDARMEHHAGPWPVDRPTMPAMLLRGLLVLPLALIAGAGASCGSAAVSYEEEVADIYRRYRRGDLEQAAKLMQQGYRDRWKVDFDADAGTMEFADDAVIWNLERGKLLLDAGRYGQAYGALEDAETVINQGFGERATISARETVDEAESLLTNQKALPYQGYVHDRVLLNCYKAIAALLEHDLDRALMEARRVEEAQDAAIRRFAADAESADRAGAAEGLHLDYGLFVESPRVREDLPWLQGADAYPPSYQGFVNPYALLVKAVLRRVKDDPNERAVVDLRNLASMVPDNRYLVEELQRADAAADPAGWVYVLFENGMAPVIESVEVEVPYGYLRAIFGSKRDGLDVLDRAFFALPVLRDGRGGRRSLVVRDGLGNEDRSERVADMEMVMRYEFERRIPGILTREVLRLIVQETAAHEVEQVAKRQDDVLGVIAKLGGLLYKSAMNRADDRSWRTVGADFQFLVRPMPDDGLLHLDLSDGGVQTLTVDLAGKDVAVLYVRSVGRNHLTVHQAGFDYGSGGIQP